MLSSRTNAMPKKYKNKLFLFENYHSQTPNNLKKRDEFNEYCSLISQNPYSLSGLHHISTQQFLQK